MVEMKSELLLRCPPVVGVTEFQHMMNNAVGEEIISERSRFF
jgi:hypothetical protein